MEMENRVTSVVMGRAQEAIDLAASPQERQALTTVIAKAVQMDRKALTKVLCFFVRAAKSFPAGSSGRRLACMRAMVVEAVLTAPTA